MLRLFTLLALLLTGCATKHTPVYEPANNDEYIEQVEAESNAEIKSNTLQTYTYAGIGLFTAGVALVAFTPKMKSGVIMMGGGGLAMGSPFIFNSEWFDWVFGIATAIIVIDGLYFLWRFSTNYFKQDKTENKP
jgi:hypothetical protein